MSPWPVASVAAGADAGGAAPTARQARGGAAARGAAAQGEGGAATGRGGSNRKMGVPWLILHTVTGS